MLDLTRKGRLAWMIASAFVLVLCVLVMLARPRRDDPLELDERARQVLARPDQVLVFTLDPDPWNASARGSVVLERTWPSMGPGTPLSAAVAERASAAVLNRDHYLVQPPPDLCAWSPSWALRFLRGGWFVDVTVDRGCSRASISGAARGGPKTPGVDAEGGGKLSDSGHAAFLEVMTDANLRWPDPTPHAMRAFAP